MFIYLKFFSATWFIGLQTYKHLHKPLLSCCWWRQVSIINRHFTAMSAPNIYIQIKIQLNLYIKSSEENLKMCPLYTGSHCVHFSLHGENKTALYRQWFVIYRCPFKEGLTVKVNKTIYYIFISCSTFTLQKSIYFN
jgi:hypothetical protein